MNNIDTDFSRLQIGDVFHPYGFPEERYMKMNDQQFMFLQNGRIIHKNDTEYFSKWLTYHDNPNRTNDEIILHLAYKGGTYEVVPREELERLQKISKKIDTEKKYCDDAFREGKEMTERIYKKQIEDNSYAIKLAERKYYIATEQIQKAIQNYYFVAQQIQQEIQKVQEIFKEIERKM